MNSDISNYLHDKKGTHVDKGAIPVCLSIVVSGEAQHVDLHSHWQHSKHETAKDINIKIEAECSVSKFSFPKCKLY